LFLRTESDAELVARTRQGDVEAFNHLVSRWEKRLYNYLLRLAGNREDALDLAQEAFLKAYQNLGTLEEAGKFPSWLYRIAHNLAFSHLRRPQLVELIEEGNQQDWSAEWPNDWNNIANPLRDAASHSLLGSPAFGREMELAVTRALESLPPEQREAIILKVYHGFRFDEIAAIISCPVSTVKTRVYAGFAQLRAMLDTAAPAGRRAQRR